MARYGLASAPGILHSMRKLDPCPTTRNPVVRLSYDHAIAVGANVPRM